MTVNNFIEELTDHFEEHQTKLVTQVICVDYIPVTIWKDNVEYYCVIESADGCSYRIVFKDHLSSEHRITGIFRDKNLGISKLIANLDAARNELANAFSEDDLTLIFDKINIELLSSISNSLENIESLEPIKVILNQNVDALISAIEHEPSKVSPILTTLLSALEDTLKVPDTVLDLWSYLNKYSVDSVTNIAEVCAKNIITTRLPKDNDMYMLLANFELLHLFFGKFCRARRFSSATQRTFQALPEFVPVLMKFGGVPHPLLDVQNESCLFETIKPLFRFLQNTELCTNICTFTGAPFDSSYTLFDYSKSETYENSRIIFGLAADFNQIYDGASIAILPQPDAWIKTDNVIYSSDLAVGVINATIAMATVLGVIPSSNKTMDSILQMSVATVENKTHIVSCTALPDLLDLQEGARLISSYVDIAILRAIVSSLTNKSDISEAIRKERLLRSALDSQQRNMLQFRDLGVNLDD